MRKVLFYGNLCNLGYNFAKAINNDDRYDFKAELMIATYYMNIMDTSNPIWEDEGIEYNLPNWIVLSKEKKIRGKGKLRSIFNLLYNYFNCKKMFFNRDIVISSTLMNIWALFCAKKYIAMTTGSDIVELAHEDNLLAKIYLKSLKKACCIGLLNTNHLDHVKQFGFDNYRFIPFAIDTSKYYQKETVNIAKPIIILHSTRLDWIEADTRPQNTKRNDVFFKGFAKFIHASENNITNRIKVIVLEFGSANDIIATKELNIGLGINDKIQYLPKCSKKDLINKYCDSDIVVDQFVVGAFGLNALEAMASGSIVLTYLKEDNALECYGDLPPMLNCKTEEDVFKSFMKLSSNNFADLKDMKAEAREWVVKHHDYKNVVPIFADIINKI